MYHNKWTYTLKTQRDIGESILFPCGESIQGLLDRAVAQAEAQTMMQLNDKATEQGVFLLYPDVHVEGHYNITRSIVSTWGIENFYEIIIDVRVEFDTDKPLSESPIDPTWVGLFYAVIKAVIAAIVIYFIAVQIKEWLESMTTTTHSIEYYDEAGNLIGRESLQTPHIPGIGGVGLILFGLVMLGLFWFAGMPKRG